MVSTLLPFALLALAFSAWPLAIGPGVPLSLHHRIDRVLNLDDPSPNFTIDTAQAHVISQTLAEIFSKNPSTGEPRTRAFVLGTEILGERDSNNQPMFVARTGKVMSLMVQDLGTKQPSEQADILNKLYLIIHRFPPLDGDEWAIKVLANEVNTEALAALQRGGSYGTIHELVHQMQV
ncbi:hypothetical protein PCANC_28264 [Puccinia coronata f. sp. avenae]|jgi:hypothetical protein|uniref:Uncharacterized protein n=1 Tax=Puccinia coronata f. sp. avenae TaxID=200324 RepID=A0A2N5TDG7_9BASI|nr:hypothetical protein PCANC_28264 [Puccinia coronata f. sp. avenae]